MQKRTESYCKIKYDEITLPDEFPLSYFKHTQKYYGSERMHFHNVLEIGICLEGSGLFFVENRVLPFTKGDVSIIFADQPHIAQSTNENPSYWYFLSTDIERLFCALEGTYYQPLEDMLYHKYQIPNIIDGGKFIDISSLAKLIFEEVENEALNYQAIVKGLLWALLFKIIQLPRISDTNKNAKKDYSCNYAAILPALNTISTKYYSDISVLKLSEICHLSERHFRRIFTMIMGFTPQKYLLQVRIRMAATLLVSTVLSVSEISYRVGFQSISSFNRDFKKAYHISPKDFRKNGCRL